LRITREVELLGGEVSSTHSRENVVLTAKYLANDLPYFVELLAEVASQSKFAGKLGRQPCRITSDGTYQINISMLTRLSSPRVAGDRDQAP
jgi:hypothetical protein